MIFENFFSVAMDRVLTEPLADYKYGKHNILNLGAGSKDIPGATPLDYPEWDADNDAIPYEDNSVMQIHAYHFLEHCADPVKVLLECQRVLRPYGIMNICVPYYSASIASQDLDHKRYFTEDTWKILFNNPYYNKNKVEWRLDVTFNLIAGIVERNICLFTQLRKRP